MARTALGVPQITTDNVPRPYRGIPNQTTEAASILGHRRERGNEEISPIKLPSIACG